MSNSISLVRRRENRRSNKPPSTKRNDSSPITKASQLKGYRDNLKQDNGSFFWSNLGGKLYFAQSYLDDGHKFSVLTILKLLLSLRAASSFWSIILDCDEVYNYWEPLHLLIYGKGFQTWEYSPEYGIRSWAYIYLHYVVSTILLPIAGNSKVILFHLIRIAVASLSLASDFLLYRSACDRLGNTIGSFFIAISCCSVGMFNASAAFLPSSFSMSMASFAIAFYLKEQWFLSILSTAISAMMGWPFAAILGFPIVVEMLIVRFKHLSIKFILYALLSGVLVFIPMFLIDSYYYGKSVIAPLNIVLYNVFSNHGPDLYGVEPVTYYLKNLVLNWNVALPFALIAVPTSLYIYFNKTQNADKEQQTNTIGYWYRFLPLVLIAAAVFLWLAIFFLQPHKEERFLFPIFPLIALLTAVGLEAITYLHPKMINLSNLVLVIFVLLSISRGYALHRNYSGSMDTYKKFHDNFLINQGKLNFNSVEGPVTLCIGKEWYRYPSSFFVPEKVTGKNGVVKEVKVEYLKSNFDGILPKHFEEGSFPEITSLIPTEMNDLNKEEQGRYYDVDKCHYVIDLDLDVYSERDAFNQKTKKAFHIIYQKPFLSAESSHPLFRAFFVPFTDQYLNFVHYSLYERKSLSHR